MKVKIVSVKKRPFTTDDGDLLDYYWYRAERLSDGVSFQFGSMDPDHEPGEELDLEIEKTEATNKKGQLVYRYKEISFGSRD